MRHYAPPVNSSEFLVVSLLHKTNRFHVALFLFSNRSQMTSKCGKNISDTTSYRLVYHLFCSYHILTSSETEQTHGNTESICQMDARGKFGEDERSVRVARDD